MKKFCQENLYKVTQPLIFFVQKSLLDVHMIVHKCQKNSSIHIENSSFFEEILPRKPLQSHATSQFFCWKKLVGCAYDWVEVTKKLFDSF